MRVRIQALLLIASLLLVIAPAATAVARPPHSIVLVQDEGTDSDQSESGDQGSEGQSDPEAETGAGSEETEEEEGPPWTFQMAKLSVLLLVALLGGTLLLYRRMIGARQKGNA